MASRFQRLQHAITPDVASNLSKTGFAIVDGALGLGVVRQLREEIEGLYEMGHMHLNSTHMVLPEHGKKQLIQKKGIFEAELFEERIQELCPLNSSLLSDRTLRTMISLYVPSIRLDSQAIKLQHSTGNGSCFPIHCDSDVTVDGRKVTAIYYLNEDWQSADDGGQLVLYPWPWSVERIVVDPLADRLVLFSSTQMLHRVLPCFKKRSCLTLWLSERRKAAAGPVGCPQKGDDRRAALTQQSAWNIVTHPELRLHAAKYYLSEEWRQSIQESHSGQEANTLLEMFDAELNMIERALPMLKNFNLNERQSVPLQWDWLK